MILVQYDIALPLSQESASQISEFIFLVEANCDPYIQLIKRQALKKRFVRERNHLDGNVRMFISEVMYDVNQRIIHVMPFLYADLYIADLSGVGALGLRQYLIVPDLQLFAFLKKQISTRGQTKPERLPVKKGKPQLTLQIGNLPGDGRL